MPTRSTIRYAAKAAYQLALMTGRTESTQCKLPCKVDFQRGVVVVGSMWESEAFMEVPIAKVWATL